jgi:hypothetical protein
VDPEGPLTTATEAPPAAEPATGAAATPDPGVAGDVGAVGDGVGVVASDVPTAVVPHGDVETLMCGVCETNPAVGVCAIPGVPASDAFCSPCLRAGAIPMWAAVANTANLGGLDQAADWWVATVEATLKVVGVSRDEFETQVAAAMESGDEVVEG